MIQLKKILCLLPALVFLIGWSSCEKKSETTPSSETKLTAIVFAANDSFPGLKKASFTIDFSQDTALVYNEDSLPVGTRIDSVVATFYFSTTIGYATFFSGDSPDARSKRLISSSESTPRKTARTNRYSRNSSVSFASCGL